MNDHGKSWAVLAALTLIVRVTATALEIESFAERSERGDMVNSTTLQCRVIMLATDDEAVWINFAVFGGNA